MNFEFLANSELGIFTCCMIQESIRGVAREYSI